MIKRFIALFAFSLVVSHPIHARDNVIIPGEKLSALAFWELSRCIVKRRPEHVSALLAHRMWGEAEAKAARSLADQGQYCGVLFPGDRLTVNPGTFHGALAAAAMAAKYEGQGLPDYSAVPDRFTVEDYRQTTALSGKARILILVMSECVFRAKPDSTLALFNTEPMSSQESLAWRELNGVLGQCLPMQGGTQLTFNRIDLRGFLGIAAHAVDAAHR